MQYDEVGNLWTKTTFSPQIEAGHGYDHTCIDPDTGTIYTHFSSVANPKPFHKTDDYGVTPFVQIGTSSLWGSHSALGMDWDVTRQRIVTFADNGGCILISAAGAFQQLQNGAFFGGQAAIGPYHQSVRYHPPSGANWLIPGNGFRAHFRLNSDNTFTPLADPPVTRFGTCGGDGVAIALDYRTGNFVYLDPFSNEMLQYNLTTDSWSGMIVPISKATGLPANIPWTNETAGSVNGFPVSIPAYGGVILYFVAHPFYVSMLTLAATLGSGTVGRSSARRRPCQGCGAPDGGA